MNHLMELDSGCVVFINYTTQFEWNTFFTLHNIETTYETILQIKNKVVNGFIAFT